MSTWLTADREKKLKDIKFPGIYVRGEWADLLTSGRKTIETRTRPLPKAWVHQKLWLIQTGEGPAQIVGVIQFSGDKRYRSKQEWENDEDKHLVTDDEYQWTEEKPKYGWLVEFAHVLPTPIPCSEIAGIKHMPGGVMTPFALVKKEKP